VDLSDLAVAVVLAGLAAIPLSLTVWALLDAARRPQWAWALADRSQAGWMAGIMFSAFTVIGGLFVSLWYLCKVRPGISAAEDGRISG
jgi:hypothetical protein